MPRRRKSQDSVRVDLSNVETRALMSEGTHQLRVAELNEEEGPQAPYLRWVFVDDNGARLYHNTSLAPQALWNLRGLLEALGVDIPKNAFDLVFSDIIGREVIVEVAHEKYEGKPQARAVNFDPVEEEPPKRKKRSADDDEEEPPRKKKDVEEAEAPRKKKRVARDEDDEEEAPRRSKKKAKTITEDEVNDMSQEELTDVVQEFELECDLDDFKTLRAMRKAVIEAATEAEVLGE